MILGIDTASKKCGYAILTLDGELVTSGVWSLRGHSAGQRRLDLHHRLMALYLEYPAISWCGFETPYVHPHWSKLTAIRLGQTAGIIEDVAWSHGVSTIEIAPKEAKKAMAHSGEATKRGVAEAVETQFGIEIPDDQHDRSDAIAIAYAVYLKLKAASREDSQ